MLDTVLRYKRPGYIELPRDMVDVTERDPGHPTNKRHRSDRESLAEALDEATELIRNSRSPVILAGVEVPRFGMQRNLARLAEAYNIPIATTLLGKSAIQETHPLHVGIYAASIGRPEVCRLIEKSDCVIMLGTFLTDIDSGIATPPLEPENCICATSERLQIQHHHFDGVLLQDFVAFGTSSPELAVSVQSALSGNAEIALGNVVGSNIFNVLFILGISAVVAPLAVSSRLIRIEVPLMIVASLGLFGLGYDGQISRLDGALLFASLTVYIYWFIRRVDHWTDNRRGRDFVAGSCHFGFGCLSRRTGDCGRKRGW